MIIFTQLGKTEEKRPRILTRRSSVFTICCIFNIYFWWCEMFLLWWWFGCFFSSVPFWFVCFIFWGVWWPGLVSFLGFGFVGGKVAINIIYSMYWRNIPNTVQFLIGKLPTPVRSRIIWVITVFCPRIQCEKSTSITLKVKCAGARA